MKDVMIRILAVQTTVDQYFADKGIEVPAE